MKIAFSTDDGESLVKDHFGEAKYFDIYELAEEGYNFLERRENKSGEEKFHGDPEKARKIGETLKDVDVLVGFQMGPNIQRMKKKFLTVVSNNLSIKDNLEILKQNYKEIEKLVEKKNVIVVIDNQKINVVK